MCLLPGGCPPWDPPQRAALGLLTAVGLGRASFRLRSHFPHRRKSGLEPGDSQNTEISSPTSCHFKGFKRPRGTHAAFAVVVWLPLWAGRCAQCAKGRGKPGLLREARCRESPKGTHCIGARALSSPGWQWHQEGPVESGDRVPALASASVVPESLQKASQRGLS